MKLIGRDTEKNELLKLYNSGKSELVAVYGRRRVGKTFLIDEVFKDKMFFKHTGVSDEELKSFNVKKKNKYQIQAFCASLKSFHLRVDAVPNNWLDAFLLLTKAIEEDKSNERKVIFIDELPWLDTAKSDFLPAFSWFWNNYAVTRDDLMVIVCGSSMSWMFDKIINARGGLYGRLTYQIKLSPLSLGEVEQLLLEKNIHLPRYEIAKLYMCFGGIPYYLNYFEPGMTVNEFIDQMFFKKNAKLKDEFDTLFVASFDETKTSLDIVKTLATKAGGFTRKDLLKKLKLSDGQYIAKTLKGLINSDFIVQYVPYKGNKKEKYYKAIDPFTLFYLKHVTNNTSLDEMVFTFKIQNNWLGSAFENLCFYHLDLIKDKLGIIAVKATQFSYNIYGEEGAQIDLVIERGDRVINLCEMKFYQSEYVVSSSEHLNLMNKIAKLSIGLKKSMIIQPVLITTFGLAKKEYCSDYPKVITLDDLFK